MNFQDLKDKELTEHIDIRAQHLGPQIEMMRRLKNAIEESSENQDKYSKAMLAISIIQMATGMIQFGYAVQTGNITFGIIWLAILFVCIWFTFKQLSHQKKDSK